MGDAGTEGAGRVTRMVWRPVAQRRSPWSRKGRTTWYPTSSRGRDRALHGPAPRETAGRGAAAGERAASGRRVAGRGAALPGRAVRDRAGRERGVVPRTQRPGGVRPAAVSDDERLHLACCIGTSGNTRRAAVRRGRSRARGGDAGVAATTTCFPAAEVTWSSPATGRHPGLVLDMARLGQHELAATTWCGRFDRW